MVCPNDSHISDEISYQSEENMLNESSHDRKSDAVLIDADFSNDLLLSSGIFNKFEKNNSEESNPGVILNIICLDHSSVFPGKLI
ncbi:unnamed protein product [Schistosoma curassoni]|uniref:Uncharacterized protein n=1 Tax=Schistosoma curassoni TaxID=6186 RepID=A0A183JXB6_9TREM|nr:unnamed protein product [Schistosoma curassoni]